MSPGYGTVQWLDQTFSSRARTEVLLRPELEAGVITEHDYAVATTFLPGYHRYYPYAYGAIATTLTASYGVMVRRPRWSHGRMVALSSAAYFLGAVFGQVRRAVAHAGFVRTLDDRAQFFQALQNVNRRLGGDDNASLEWGDDPAAPRQHQHQHQRNEQQKTDMSGDAVPAEQESAWSASPSPVPRNAPSGGQSSTSSAQSTRWDEIRAANARNARSSSWDALRQQHQRPAVVDTVQPSPGSYSGAESDTERIAEQARFDALLEAERKLSRG